MDVRFSSVYSNYKFKTIYVTEKKLLPPGLCSELPSPNHLAQRIPQRPTLPPTDKEPEKMNNDQKKRGKKKRGKNKGYCVVAVNVTVTKQVQ